MPYSAGRMLTSKIAYFARNSAAEFIQAYLHTFLTSNFCCLSSAAAYQSIIMLMGKQQLFAHWQAQAKVAHFEWSEEAASQVLESWKREFTKVRKMNSDYFTSFISPPSPFPCIHLPLNRGIMVVWMENSTKLYPKPNLSL